MKITSYPRIHIGLVNMSGCDGEIYGGAGFSINFSPVEIEATHSRKRKVVYADNCGATAYESEIIQVVKYYELISGSKFNIVFLKSIPQHIGLGSKTSILMALCELLSGLTSSTPVNAALLCKRGGASGVGINTFYEGGVVFDSGHRYCKGDLIAPSRYRQKYTPPIVKNRYVFPKTWKVHLLLPEGKKISGADELSIFKENTPVDVIETNKVRKAFEEMLVTAFLTEDYFRLSRGLREISTIGFKKVEIDHQSEECGIILEELYQNVGAACGMSSMGPMIYAISNSKEMDDAIISISKKQHAKHLGVFEGRNQGYNLTKGLEQS